MLSKRTRKSRQRTRKQRLAIIAIGLLILTTTLILLVVINKKAPVIPIPISVKAVVVGKQEVKVGLPIRLKIPVLSIDAVIGYAGTAPDGTMEITSSQDNVAWYEPGTRPGAVGSAVIAGHYGSLNGKWSVFSYLSKLKAGDKLYIQDSNDALITFAVRETRNYDPTANATNIFKSHDGLSHLNLITCEGSWNKAQQSYSSRLVIFSDKI